MRRMLRFAALALAVLLALSLCACSVPDLMQGPEALYRLPELPVRYTALNQKLAAVLEEGAEYAPPVSGANIQPVQMVDLDADGREEAVAFFRKADEEKPLLICVFAADGQEYEQIASISGSGTAIYSIAYNDLNGDGRTELLVGWRVSTELQALTVYTFRSDEAEELLRTDYVKYIASDLDSDRQREMVVLRSDQNGECVADYYDWSGSSLIAAGGSRISMTVAELSQQGRLAAGTLRGGAPALFITGVAGASPAASAVTDILAVRGEALANVTLSDATGVSSIISPYHSLYPADIDGDGVTDVPWTVLGEGEGETPGDYRYIEWKNYDADGAAETVRCTYHAIEDGWYFRLPEQWTKQVVAERATLPEEAAVTFYRCDRAGRAVQPILRVSTLTGPSRERVALRGSRMVLSRQAGAIYTAEIPESTAPWEHSMDADAVRAAFSLIPTEWASYDY